MRIEFETKNHVYSVDGDIAAISVTELLRKHGISPDYSSVPSDVLTASAERGKAIHKDLENVMNENNYDPETDEGKAFAEWAKENLDCGVGEQMVAYDYNGMLVAGTADLIGISKIGEYIVADHKNTSSFYKESVTWQVSILDYFLRKLNGGLVNGKPIHWRGADKFICFHYTEGKMEVKELEKIPDKEIERLLDAEYRNEIYQRRELVIEDELRLRVMEAEETLISIEKQKKVAEANAKELRSILLREMKRQGIEKWSTDRFTVSYVCGYERNTVDTAKLKKQYPMVYSDCQKISKVSESIKITEKEGDEQ